MIKCILTLLLLSSTLTYSQFIVKDSAWWTGYSCNHWGNFGFDIYSIGTKGGDTTITGKFYKILWSQTSPNSSNLVRHGLIREDKLGKVFIRFSSGSNEELLYDFGASVGDTIYSFFHSFQLHGGGEWRVLSTTDTLLYGKQRKMVALVSNHGPHLVDSIYWIEGLGSFLNVLDFPSQNRKLFYQGLIPNSVVDCGQALGFCFWEKDSLIYSNPDVPTSGDCYPWGYFGLGIQQTKSSDLMIFPQPSMGILNVKLKNWRYPVLIEIMDQRGKIIKEIFLISSQIEIDLSIYGKGLYFLRSKDLGITRKIILNQ